MSCRSRKQDLKMKNENDEKRESNRNDTNRVPRVFHLSLSIFTFLVISVMRKLENGDCDNNMVSCSSIYIHNKDKTLSLTY